MPWITARYASRCASPDCRADIEEGDRVFYNPATRKVYCEEDGVDEQDAED